MPRNWTPVEDALLTTLPAAEVQRITGRTMGSIIARRVLLKRKGELIADQRTSAEKRKVGRSAWTPEADELVRQHRPYIVARMTGIPPQTVLRRRKALGMPPIGYRPRKRSPPRQRPAHKRWSKRELRIALAMPPRDGLKRLPNRTLSAITAVRNMRKRKGIKFKGHKGRPRKVER